MRSKIHQKIKNKIDNRILLFRVFDEPRPKYIAQVMMTDKIINTIFLWAFPAYIKPNYITIFRFLSIPFIVFFLLNEDYEVAFILFILAAFSDAVDGAIARIRDKITAWGIVFDPFTDKLLIGIVGGILIINFLNPLLAFTIIFLELILVGSAYYRFKGKIVPAKIAGKIKMTLQCIGVGFIFAFLLTGNSIFLTIATYILYLAVVFAFLSFLIYKSI